MSWDHWKRLTIGATLGCVGELWRYLFGRERASASRSEYRPENRTSLAGLGCYMMQEAQQVVFASAQNISFPESYGSGEGKIVSEIVRLKLGWDFGRDVRCITPSPLA